MATEYFEGQKIKFDSGFASGEGEIIGIASNQPILGNNLMVKSIANGITCMGGDTLPTKVYPFNTIAVFECHVTEIEKDGKYISVKFDPAEKILKNKG